MTLIRIWINTWFPAFSIVLNRSKKQQSYVFLILLMCFWELAVVGVKVPASVGKMLILKLGL